MTWASKAVSAGRSKPLATPIAKTTARIPSSRERAARREDRERDAQKRRRDRARDEDDRAAVAAVGEVAAEQHERERRDRLDQTEPAERQRVAGDVVGLERDDRREARSSARRSSTGRRGARGTRAAGRGDRSRPHDVASAPMATGRAGSARRYASAVDLVLLRGTLIDGTADAQPHLADIGISGDRIVAIGDLSATDAEETIDAAGLAVAPGSPDPHTDVETAILEERHGPPRRPRPPARGHDTHSRTDGFGWAPLEASAARELWAGTAGIHGPVPRVLAGTASGSPSRRTWRHSRASRRSISCHRSPARQCVSQPLAGQVARRRHANWT